jgi:hypothetical protein
VSKRVSLSHFWFPSGFIRAIRSTCMSETDAPRDGVDSDA